MQLDHVDVSYPAGDTESFAYARQIAAVLTESGFHVQAGIQITTGTADPRNPSGLVFVCSGLPPPEGVQAIISSFQQAGIIGTIDPTSNVRTPMLTIMVNPRPL